MLDLPHVAARLYGAPLMIARAKLDVILGVMAPRLAGRMAFPVGDEDPFEAPDTQVTPDGIAIISVMGSLVNRSSYLGAASGLSSYSDIGEDIEAAATDPNVRAILLDIDSPGGEVGGLFDLVDQIQAIRSQCGKPIWAVADEAALSAAYAIGCVADRFYVTQTGEVGSVGVVAVHLDESGADTQAGLTWSFIHAGSAKIDGNSHQPLSDTARATLQADVDALYGRFIDLVAKCRKTTPDAIRATEAGIYRGDQAVAMGLADKVGTLRVALADLGATLARPSPRSPVLSKSKEFIMSEQTGDIPVMAAVQQPVVEPSAEIEQRLRAEYSEISAIAAQAARLGVSIDAADALTKGIKPEALRRSVLEQLVARSDAADVLATAPIPAAKPSTESPIVRRAREAASRHGE
ncbi:putative Phage minor capsid protein C [Magnetospirillum sp. XM-1]|uniref:S49 family peptidase n=1 Tax=Magnetospirillum sp. XM-1 TaxID=1663591 RepID=UPI00073DCB8B|nr:S49 family peptidase [Magnetospirillum sp. XM-1]CUW37116.1 putative Phage minor capsid protein C [Magnetospirillum sp. XM-1]